MVASSVQEEKWTGTVTFPGPVFSVFMRHCPEGATSRKSLHWELSSVLRAKVTGRKRKRRRRTTVSHNFAWCQFQFYTYTTLKVRNYPFNLYCQPNQSSDLFLNSLIPTFIIMVSDICSLWKLIYFTSISWSFLNVY